MMGPLTTILLFLQTSNNFAQKAPEMTVAGWVFMSAAWIFITSLTYYTFAKILRGNKKR